MALRRNEFAAKVQEKVQQTGLPTKPNQPQQRLKLFNIRLVDADKEILRQHFRNKGLDLSSGVRMVLYEYMEREGLK